MSLEKMEALEVRVRQLVDLVQELKQTNGSLQRELRVAQEQLMKQEALSHEWEEERKTIKSRIERIIDELDGLELSETELQGVTRDQGH